MEEFGRLSSEEVEALPWEEVASSNVHRVAFVPGGAAAGDPLAVKMPVGSLYIQFHGSSGRVYRYADVPQPAHAELLEADSVGGYLNAEIEPSHDCERIEVSA